MALFYDFYKKKSSGFHLLIQSAVWIFPGLSTGFTRNFCSESCKSFFRKLSKVFFWESSKNNTRNSLEVLSVNLPGL